MNPSTSVPRFDVTTLGEMLVRLSVPSGKRIENATQFDVYPAGAEANVATLLARLERQACWMGALPENPLGRLAFHALRAAGVDTGGVLWKNSGRMGTYYVEFGEPPRGIQVTYDRANSCATQIAGRRNQLGIAARYTSPAFDRYHPRAFSFLSRNCHSSHTKSKRTKRAGEFRYQLSAKTLVGGRS